MKDNQLIDNLRQIKLSGVAEAYLEQLVSKQYFDLPFEERLNFLLEAELLKRNNNRITARIKASGLKQQPSAEQIDFQVSRGLSKTKFLELLTCSWVSSKHNLIITGSTGVGKTFLASVLGNQACRLGMSVKYYKLSDLLFEIAAAKATANLNKFTYKLARLNLLIIDEWLREPLAQSLVKDILDILDDRYRVGAVVFVSQLPVANWYSYIPDQTIADAIMDRIIHDSIRLELAGESMRKITSKVENKII